MYVRYKKSQVLRVLASEIIIFSLVSSYSFLILEQTNEFNLPLFLFFCFSPSYVQKRTVLFGREKHSIIRLLARRDRFVDDNSKWRTSIVGDCVDQALVLPSSLTVCGARGGRERAVSRLDVLRNRIGCWTDITAVYTTFDNLRTSFFLFFFFKCTNEIYKLSRSLYAYNLNQCTLEEWFLFFPFLFFFCCLSFLLSDDLKSVSHSLTK